jgi:hypothetical protein
MMKEEVGKLLPEVLPTVRERVAGRNAARGAQSRNGSSADLNDQCNCLAPIQVNPTIPE